jgi:hypothetical protein
MTDPFEPNEVRTWRNYGTMHVDPELDMKYGIICTWHECRNPIEVYRTKTEAKRALYRIVSETWNMYELSTMQSFYYKTCAYFGWPTRQPGMTASDTQIYIVDLDSLVLTK